LAARNLDRRVTAWGRYCRFGALSSKHSIAFRRQIGRPAHRGVVS